MRARAVVADWMLLWTMMCGPPLAAGALGAILWPVEIQGGARFSWYVERASSVLAHIWAPGKSEVEHEFAAVAVAIEYRDAP